MKIETARLADLNAILKIYGEAREFMRETGNPTQWGAAYPDRATLEADIDGKRLFKLTDGEETLGVFCFFIGEEPTYRKIYGGEWESADPCGVIHRVAIASAARGRGAVREIFAFASARVPYIRIDTHRDNAPMQRALLKFGFERRGIIYLASGDERVAFDYRRKEI